MNIWHWFRTKIEAWLGISELRTQVTDLQAQLRALGNLQSDSAVSLETQSRRIDTMLTTANTAVMEAEERLLIRVAAVEERLSGGDYTKNEANSPSGGFVPWTERKRRAEMAASDPSKWVRKPAVQEK